LYANSPDSHTRACREHENRQHPEWSHPHARLDQEHQRPRSIGAEPPGPRRMAETSISIINQAWPADFHAHIQTALRNHDHGAQPSRSRTYRSIQADTNRCNNVADYAEAVTHKCANGGRIPNGAKPTLPENGFEWIDRRIADSRNQGRRRGDWAPVKAPVGLPFWDTALRHRTWLGTKLEGLDPLSQPPGRPRETSVH